MKNIIKKTALILIFIQLTFFANAQFEQKFTMQFSAGYSILQGGLTDIFNNGITIDGGLQYNFNRNFSLVSLAKYGTYFFNDNTGYNIEGKYNNLGISICPKYKFLKDNLFNPYIFGGININYIKFSFNGVDFKAPLCFGYLGGVGGEFQINENFAIFSQLGYSHIKYKADGYEDNFNSVFIQFGVNINMFKSKSL